MHPPPRYACFLGYLYIILNVSVFRIRIRLDPFHFGQPESDPFHETATEGKKSTKIVHFFKNVKLFFRDPDPDSDQNETDPKHWNQGSILLSFPSGRGVGI